MDFAVQTPGCGLVLGELTRDRCRQLADAVAGVRELPGARTHITGGFYGIAISASGDYV